LSQRVTGILKAQSAQSADEWKARSLVNRLYQWLHERATFFRTEVRESDTRRIVRTQVTVEEQQRTMLLPLTAMDGVCLCPLCGQRLTPLAAESSGAVTLEHSQVHTRCPGPEQVDEVKDPRLGKPGDIRRLL
jgi:hypothetical protein